MSRLANSPNNTQGSHKRWWAVAAGGVALLALAVVLTLHFRYCLFCSDARRVERAAQLLCDTSDSAMCRALSILEQAAANGHPEALSLRGEIYLDTLPERYVLSRPDLVNCVRGRLAPDADKARASLRRLATSADAGPQALYNLGILLESGQLNGIKLENSAQEYFRRSAETGNPFGLFALGWQAHLRGDYAGAAARFRAAYEQGEHPEAALLLGDYHLYGHGMARNRSKALEWYNEALAAAKKPAFQGLIGHLAFAARQRLQLAASPDAEQEDLEPVVVEYRLAGTPDEYRVFIAGQPDRPIGSVVAANGAASARFADEEKPEEQQFATMTAGLDWILQTYAAQRHGAGQKFRFRLMQ